MADLKIEPKTVADIIPPARAQTTRPAGSQEDSFLSNVIDMFDGLKVQIELGDYDKRLNIGGERTAAVLSLNVHDCHDRMLFGVILEPVKSALSRNARYQINAFKVFIEGEKNYSESLETIERGDAKKFADIRNKLQERVGAMIEDYYRASAATRSLAKPISGLVH